MQGRNTLPDERYQVDRMRKIESQMLDAMRTGKSWAYANTRVNVISVDDSRITEVYLHDKLIAEIGLTRITLWNRGWATPTTKSRLNAILSGIDSSMRIHQNDFVWYITDYRNRESVPTRFVDGEEFYI